MTVSVARIAPGREGETIVLGRKHSKYGRGEGQGRMHAGEKGGEVQGTLLD